ncbi:MAG TPA: carboxypeptidase-like regulatory domain-containing protein [Thermoanaerobaculia bacterium]|nr:carboxypeptidase-like regulatory domain-containing protein [Thermoanaerobaculia bacterium]
MFGVLGLLLLGSACPAAADGQPSTAVLAGVIVDARTRQPLAGAMVELSKPPRSVATDQQGLFCFEAVPVGPHELFVSLVGYAFGRYSVEVPAAGAEVTLTLAEGAAAYNETVTVRGDPFGDGEPGVAGQQSLDSGELRQLGGMVLDDPLRAVQSLSGVTASDDFYGELAVRGHELRRLAYTLDSVPASFLVHTLKYVEDGASVAMINGDLLDYASLLRGAYPQRFGQRLGAGLELATSEGSRERARYNLTASGTSASLTGDGPLGNSARGSWLVSARRSYLDLFIRQVLHDSSLAFGFADVLTKVTYDVTAGDQIQLAAVAGRSRFDETEVQDSPTSLDSASHAGWMETMAWRHTSESATTLNQLTSRLFLTGESFDNRNALGARVAEGRGSDYGIRLDFGSTTARRAFEVGWSLERLHGREELAFRVPGWHVTGGEDFAAHGSKVGGYGQARWALGPATLTVGSRVDRFGLVDGWTASPWLLADWKAARGLRLILDVGLAHQFPELAQLAGRRGDPGLRPERAIHLDAGVEGRWRETLRWQVTVYNREDRDLVDLPRQYPQRLGGELQLPSAISRYANRLGGYSRGVEVMLQRKSQGGLSGWVAYAYAHTRYTDSVTGERFDGDFDQRHTINLFGRYRLSDRTSVTARWRYGSNRPLAGYLESGPDGRLFVGSQRNSVRVPAYSRLDLRADRTYRWGRHRLTLFAEVANLLNRENFAQMPPTIDSRSGEAFDKLRRQFPRVPSLGIALEL